MSESTMQKKNRVEPTTAEQTRSGVYFTPRVDIVEDEKELVVYADMPGVAPGNVDLRYENGELVLHGRVQPRQQTGASLLREYQDGDYYRVFQVHESIDSSRIEAVCKNGVLTIHLPKAEAVRPRKVQVRAE
ncbi:MAG TPA: Hsp20/alpha crystallin family protein [Gemmataceae bacterium]|nr:Hsp20/alpha crystallin family protein [Gemmataceae bacterium]